MLHHCPKVRDRHRLFLAVPVYGSMPALTSFCLFQAHEVLLKAEIDTELLIWEGHCHVDDVRNLIVSKFLESACDELLFIDADLGWQAETLLEFVRYDKDVVAATYRKKKDDMEFPCRMLDGDVYSRDGLIEVDGVPTGFLKIKRHVLEKMFEVSRKYVDQGVNCAEIFNRDVIDGKRMSGDYNFCRKWREFGKVHVAPEMWMEHVGNKTWGGSFGSYLRVMNGLDLQCLGKIRDGTYKRSDLIPMVQEWGNAFAASHELLAACIDVARQAKGPIIETGSGLSSLVMAATGAEVHCLEHDPSWYSRIVEAKRRFNLDSLTVHYAPLKKYPDGTWYGPAVLPWRECDILLCDGPPRKAANRDVLFRVLREQGAAPRCILQDDVEGGLPDIGYSFELMGVVRPFAVGKKLEKAA